MSWRAYTAYTPLTIADSQKTSTTWKSLLMYPHQLSWRWSWIIQETPIPLCRIWFETWVCHQVWTCLRAVPSMHAIHMAWTVHWKTWFRLGLTWVMIASFATISQVYVGCYVWFNRIMWWRETIRCKSTRRIIADEFGRNVELCGHDRTLHVREYLLCLDRLNITSCNYW